MQVKLQPHLSIHLTPTDKGVLSKPEGKGLVELSTHDAIQATDEQLETKLQDQDKREKTSLLSPYKKGGLSPKGLNNESDMAPSLKVKTVMRRKNGHVSYEVKALPGDDDKKSVADGETLFTYPSKPRDKPLVSRAYTQYAKNKISE